MSDRKIEKRNRPPVSCNPCRSRKLKCNRALPCDTCVKRGKEDICQYAPNADRSKAEAKKGAVADQLKRLEDMIFSLAEQKTSPSGSSTTQSSSTADQSKADSASVPEDPATSTTRFTESNHWLSIIEDIKDIRAQLSPGLGQGIPTNSSVVPATSESASAASPVSTADLGLGHARTVSIDHILEGLPSRQICDFWVSQHFQARFTTLPLLHPTKFQNEYETFWEDRTKVTPIWIALLASILSLAAGTIKVPDMSGGHPTNIPTVQDLSLLTQQCLILGNYTAGGEYVMETLVLHMQSFFLTGKDATQDIWFVEGVTIRLALRLGYHRDPSNQRNLSNLSPYECEMRRRVWMTIYQLDAIISFQVGLPSMIPVDSCDTRPPLNLELSYMDPEAQELPPPRPMTDHTSATYTIAKQPIIDMFKKIVAHTQALTPRPYQETLQLDTMLRTAYDNLPEVLKAKPISRSLVDGNSLVIRRMTLEFLFLKTMVILHREHLNHRGNALTSTSHQACLRASLVILERLTELHQSMRPGGLLYSDRWILTTLNMSDMIFGSVVLCLDLTIRVSTPPCACHVGLSPQAPKSVVTLEMALDAVEKAKKVWEVIGETSGEARLAAGALEATIQRVKEYQRNESTPYEAFQRVSFDNTGLGPIMDDGESFGLLGDTLHWEFIDQWMPDLDEDMPDLASWVLHGTT